MSERAVINKFEYDAETAAAVASSSPANGLSRNLFDVVYLTLYLENKYDRTFKRQ
jgi:hypothetical protein